MTKEKSLEELIALFGTGYWLWIGTNSLDDAVKFSSNPDDWTYNTAGGGYWQVEATYVVYKKPTTWVIIPPGNEWRNVTDQKDKFRRKRLEKELQNVQ